MAALKGSEVVRDPLGSAAKFRGLNGSYANVAIPTVTVVYFKMRARDVDCITLTYRTWVVQNAPDPTGASYLGAKCGASAFEDVIIADSWQV